MKKFLVMLISIILSGIMLVAAGCSIGTYNPGITTDSPPPPTRPGGDDKPGGPGTPGGPDTPDTPDVPDEPEGFTYTVTLIKLADEGYPIRFHPVPDTIEAQWIGEDGSLYTAMFDATGVATRKGLDGEYSVKLSGLPSGYTYDPNGVYTDNDIRDINIELIPFASLGKGKGTGMYERIHINTEGIFAITIDTSKIADRGIWFEYEPQRRGVYSVESMADVKDGKINPKMIKYEGSIAYVNEYTREEINDGGVSGTYTKNFKWQLTVEDDSFVGNVWIFNFTAATVDNKYPVTFYIRILYLSDVNPREIVQANGPFYDDIYKSASMPSGSSWQWSYRDNVGNGGRFYTDGTFGENGNPMRFRLWWVDNNGNGVYDKDVDEGDGFYHFYNPDGYTDPITGVTYTDGYTDPITGVTYPVGYGPLLWAVVDGWDEIQHFQVGGAPPTPPSPAPNLRGSRAFTQTKNYSYFMDEYAKISHCKRISNLPGTGNYGSCGIHPVNDELMKAIQEFATTLDYFRDGDGYAENGPIDPDGYDSRIRVDSDEDHMWLIFCGYFK